MGVRAKGGRAVQFRLRAVLERLGRSQRDLAEALGLHESRVSRLGAIDGFPSWMTAVRIARELSVSLDELAGLGAPKNPAPARVGRARAVAHDSEENHAHAGPTD